MRRFATFCVFAVAAAGVLALIGCGSSGSSSLTGSSRVAVLVTDSFREDYAHIWATIYHVELTPQSGTPVILFDDPNGRQIDLKTLRDASGARFSFLGNASIPTGTYTGITITIGATMQLFQNGTAVGNPLPVDSSIPKDTAGHPVLTLTFSTPKTLGTGTNTVVVDFDLAHFVLRNSKVLPAVKEGDLTGTTDPLRHNADEYRGTISNLSGTAPALTFTLDRGNGMTVTVVTTASTAVYGASSLATSSLANGGVVEISGTIDPTTQNLVATQLEVEGAGASPTESEGQKTPRVFGAASNLNATSGTFTVTVTQANGFMPAQTTVNVVTNSSTVFRADGGGTLTQAELFTALATTSNVALTGTYDSTTNTLTATAVKIVDASQNGGWEHDAHAYRSGVNGANWGHGVFH